MSGTGKTEMNIGAFVISLQRSEGRRAHAEWIVKNLPLDAEVLNAVDGSALTATEVSQHYRRQTCTPRYPFALSRGEVGCFLSHRKAWQTILDRDLDAALIVEDDITFDVKEVDSALRFLSEIVTDGDYVQLQVRPVGGLPQSSSEKSFRLVEPVPAMLRTTAQFVTRGAAKRLLTETGLFDRPVDTFLQLVWVTGVRLKVITPGVVRELSETLGGSTLGGTVRPWHERLKRELLRPIYRARVRSRSLKALR